MAVSGVNAVTGARRGWMLHPQRVYDTRAPTWRTIYVVAFYARGAYPSYEPGPAIRTRTLVGEGKLPRVVRVLTKEWALVAMMDVNV